MAFIRSSLAMVLSTYDDCLYQLQEQGWIRYSKIVRQSNRLLFHSQGVFVDTVPKLHRATVYRKRDRWVCSGFGEILLASADSIQSLLDQIQLSPIGEKWCVKNVDLSDDGNTIADAIRNRVAIALSDGPFKDTYGTAAGS
jgi:hypothetical protein